MQSDIRSMDDGEAAIRLIIELSCALHRYGVAAHDLEEAMCETAETLGVQASYFATPTSIFIAFGDTAEQRTSLLRVSPGEVNLGKLANLHVLQRRLADGEMLAKEGLEETRRVLNSRPRYNWGHNVAAFGMATGTAAVFFGGGWDEVLLAFAVGLILGGLSWLTSGSPAAQRLFLPVASFSASLLSLSAGLMFADMTSGIITVSSLIILIPGLSLTVAMSELSTQNLASGTARFAGALAQFMIIGFGVALARSLFALVAEPAANVPGDELGLPYVILSVAIASLAFTILFQARPRDFVWVMLAGFVAFFCAKLGVRVLGPLAGPSFAAAALGLLSNELSRRLQHPAAITLVPGLLLLVPGSIGFNSIAALLNGKALESFESAYSMVLVAAAIVAGLLLANLISHLRPSTG